jgi:Ca-activated chloride channel family protein
MNTDDPKFTAHILGELEDLTPAERAEIEALLASDPTAAAEAEETRALAARLRAELAGETAPALGDGQRAAVLQAAGELIPEKKIVRFPRRMRVLTAIAAAVAIMAGASFYFPNLLFRQRGSGPAEMVAKESSDEASDPIASEETTDKAPSLLTLQRTKPTALSLDDAKTGSVPDERLAINGTTPDSSRLTIAPARPVPQAPAMIFAPAGVGGVGKVSKGPVNAAYTVRGDLAFEEPVPTPGAAAASSKAVPFARSVGSQTASPMPQTATAQKDDKFANEEEYGIAAYNQRRAKAMADVDQAWAQPVRRFAGEAPDAGEDRPITAAFEALPENGFFTVRDQPLSTFSIDVDTASYSIVRRSLNANQVPPKGSVRIEEMLNYFTYDYPLPHGDAPFSATMEVADCPWAAGHRLVRIGLRGREIARAQRPPSNLIFLIDVSGSMDMPNKLPLLKQCFGLLIDQLGPEDQVAIVVYAGESGCVLEPTHNKAKMRDALRQLHADGSTNGASGLQMAYKIAEKSFIKGGTNRVILATDGDWNVGVTDHNELLDMIARKAKTGVFLTALGFGVDNLKDTMLVKLADRGNGHYAYIDTLLEAKKVFVEQLTSTLMTIAKDVKIQVEFNPAQVGAYRLIGYEKRALAKEDFNNDRKDAGEIGAGHTVTALYEVVPAGQELAGLARVDALKYQPGTKKSAEENPDSPAVDGPAPRPESSPKGYSADRPSGAAALPVPVREELLTLKVRYKAPDGDTSKLLDFPLTDRGETWARSSVDFRFAAAVAGYGMLLRDSSHLGDVTWGSVTEWAQEGLGPDASGYRKEFLGLVEKARALEH